MTDHFNYVKENFSRFLYVESSPSILIPRQRNLTFLYDPKHDCMLSVSCHSDAIILMRDFLQFNEQRSFLCATVAKEGFLPRDNFMFYSVRSHDLEWEDPDGHCLNPDIEYVEKDRKAALKSIFANQMTIKKAIYLMDKCHALSNIHSVLSQANKHKELIKAAYLKNADVQEMIAKQYAYDQELLRTEEYQDLFDSCINIPSF